jgi:DNA-binding response OmpR family regulator
MASILLLEDNYDLLRLYSKALTAAGHRVEPSMTVEAALDVFGQLRFDLIISDLRVGSFSIERLIKRLKKLHDDGTPILVISAHMDLYQPMCDESELSDTLAKPFEHHELLDKVSSMLTTYGSVNS